MKVKDINFNPLKDHDLIDVYWDNIYIETDNLSTIKSYYSFDEVLYYDEHIISLDIDFKCM